MMKKVFVRNVDGTSLLGLHFQVRKVKSVVKILRCINFCLVEPKKRLTKAGEACTVHNVPVLHL